MQLSIYTVTNVLTYYVVEENNKKGAILQLSGDDASNSTMQST